MFAADLFQPVAHAVEETLVGGEHFAAQVELDDGRGTQQGIDQPFVFVRGGDGAGQVVGTEGEVGQFAAAVQHRLPDGAQPGLLTVAAEQAEGAAEVLAVAQRLLQAGIVGFRTERRGDQRIQRAAE